MVFLPGRTYSKELILPDGSPVIRIESVDVVAGSIVNLRIESASQERRHGIYFQTDGLLRRGRVKKAAFEFWVDEIDGPEEFVVDSTAGRMIFYQVWDSGRGRRSLTDFCGMVVEEHNSRRKRYRCEDSGQSLTFTDLVFDLEISH